MTSCGTSQDHICPHTQSTKHKAHSTHGNSNSNSRFSPSIGAHFSSHFPPPLSNTHTHTHTHTHAAKLLHLLSTNSLHLVAANPNPLHLSYNDRSYAIIQFASEAHLYMPLIADNATFMQTIGMMPQLEVTIRYEQFSINFSNIHT